LSRLKFEIALVRASWGLPRKVRIKILRKFIEDHYDEIVKLDFRRFTDEEIKILWEAKPKRAIYEKLLEEIRRRWG